MLGLRRGIVDLDLAEDVTRVPHRELPPDEGRHSDTKPNGK